MNGLLSSLTIHRMLGNSRDPARAGNADAARPATPPPSTARRPTLILSIVSALLVLASPILPAARMLWCEALVLVRHVTRKIAEGIKD